MARLNDKKFKNDVCQACIQKQLKKYGKFAIKCNGITCDEDVAFAIEHAGMTEEDARYIYDPAYFFEYSYGSAAREYQLAPLRCTSRSLVARQCRQTGKTLAIVNKILHFVGTNSGKTVLIICPQETQVKKIWDEYIFRDGIDKNAKMKASMTSKREKPFYQVTFDNGSKIMLMIAGPGVRSQTADWIYIDEAAIINADLLKDIIMTIASRGDNAHILMTSTPKGRGNKFYEACKEDPEFAEYHVSIYDVKEMSGQVERFRKLLGDTGFVQEAEAEFPDISGGPFNLRGISMAMHEYEYEDEKKEPGYIYFGGVDWNGPGIGTYFYIVGFNPDNNDIKVVDKRIVASVNWNSLIAKRELIELNRKWQPKHWLCDYGYSQSLIEELKIFSMKCGEKPSHPDSQLKYILETVAFGATLLVEDPFSKEESKKTTKSFMVGQVARLFEIKDNNVAMTFSKFDDELKKSLEFYKLLQITSSGQEKYGLDSKDGVEDHAIDAFMLACYGIIKYYGELFKRIVQSSVLLSSRQTLMPLMEDELEKKIIAGSIVLLTDNSPEPIHLDDRKIYDPTENRREIIISRGFSKGMQRKNNGGNLSGLMHNRGGLIKRNNFE